jgi:uncharacterized protein YggU (UPF0235/DUF167 family)
MFVVGNLLSAVATVLDYVLQGVWLVLLIDALLSWVRPDPSNPIVRFLDTVSDAVCESHPAARADGVRRARSGAARRDAAHHVPAAVRGRVPARDGDAARLMRLTLRVQPNARRAGLLARMPGGEWRLAVTAPPVEGAANEAVVELLSTLLGVKRRCITVVRGESSRTKTIEVEGLDDDEARMRLERALAATTGKGERFDDGE